ncbi:hypothetical protein [Bradyrhizobium sp.]|uniref:hypothetical protein n=1 Tax=Bradyrhizobium sp. TaxID=376 RepID=UPI00238F1DEB|nr:hypothetical protein [Bradyrhizobium sp.]MDE2376123.1 hypothetical protein [Bradyrhizobium sp.]
MALFALDIVFWLVGVRGHIPRFDDFRPEPAVPAAGPVHAARVLAVTVAVLAVLALTVWTTVWLAIRLF